MIYLFPLHWITQQHLGNAKQSWRQTVLSAARTDQTISSPNCADDERSEVTPHSFHIAAINVFVEGLPFSRSRRSIWPVVVIASSSMLPCSCLRTSCNKECSTISTPITSIMYSLLNSKLSCTQHCSLCWLPGCNSTERGYHSVCSCGNLNYTLI